VKGAAVTKEQVIKALAIEKLHPGVPEIVVAIIHITRSRSASINDLVRVIEGDEALSARLLSIANSGFYGLDRKVRNISDAVVLMGWNTVKMISLGSTIMKMISERDMRLYSHSIRNAQIAKHLATEAKFYKVEEISVVGLLHDIGSIILQAYFNDLFLEAKQYAVDHGVPIYIAEREVLGVDHAEVGGWTVEEWMLPDNIVESIALHHAFDPNTYHARKTAVIHVADSLAIMADFYGPTWEKVPEIHTAAIKTLGFTVDTFRKLASTCMKQKFEPLIM